MYLYVADYMYIHATSIGKPSSAFNSGLMPPNKITDV